MLINRTRQKGRWNVAGNLDCEILYDAYVGNDGEAKMPIRFVYFPFSISCIIIQLGPDFCHHSAHHLIEKRIFSCKIISYSVHATDISFLIAVLKFRINLVFRFRTNRH